MVDVGRSRPAHEDETQRAAKQQRTSHTSQRGMKRGDNQPPEPQTWPLTPMLNGEPLRDNASLRDFNGGYWKPCCLSSRGGFVTPERYGQAIEYQEK